MTSHEMRCANCGCGLSDGAVACAACGIAPLAASVGGVSAQSYQLAPAPVDSYDIELGPSQALSWTFRLWSENLGRLAALGFVPYALMLPFGAAAAAAFIWPFGGLSDFDPWGEGTWPFVAAAATVVGLLYAVVTVAVTGAVIHLVNEKTQGVSVGPVQAMGAALRHSGWLLCAWLALMVVVSIGVGGVVGPIAYGFIESNATNAMLLLLPGLGLAFGSFMLVARLTPLMPVIVLEDKDVFSALSRSWQLTRGHTADVALAALLFCLCYGGVSMAANMVGIIPILGMFVQLGLSALLMPLAWIFPFVIYAGTVRAAQRQS